MRILLCVLLASSRDLLANVLDEIQGDNCQLEDMCSKVDEILSVGSEAFDTLSNTTISSFANKFLKMKTEAVLSAFQSVALLAANHSGYVNVTESFDTENVYNKLEELHTYREQLNASKDIEKLFYDNVALPVAVAWKAMRSYRTIPDKDEFMKLYDQVDGATHFFDSWTSFILKNITVDSRYNTKVFTEAQNTIAKYLFRVYIAKYFHAGVNYSEKRFTSEIQNLESEFREDLEQITNKFATAFNNLKNESFPGFIKEDITRRIFECMNGKQTNCSVPRSNDNCEMARNIVNMISAQYPWNHYGVIVANGGTIRGYSYFGYPAKMVLDTNYNGKDVIVFMATENTFENKLKYTNDNVADTITSFRNKDVSIDNILNIARNSGGWMQMAILEKRSWSCFRTDDDSVGDSVSVMLRLSRFLRDTYDVHVVF